MDSADQLHGWPIPAVLQSGARSGLDPADIYGCLFVHVRDQLAEMARRGHNVSWMRPGLSAVQGITVDPDGAFDAVGETRQSSSGGLTL